MHRTFTQFLFVCLMLPTALPGAREILLQLAPENDAPVIAKITATDKVILDAAPAGENADSDWRQLALPTPFEGYVPVATLDKQFAIVPGTPVRYLPAIHSAEITRVENGDRYELVRRQKGWATVRFYKSITGYFSQKVPIDFDASATPGSQIPGFAPSEPARPDPQKNNAASRNQALQPAPLTIPAPRHSINPDAPISQLDPDDLPPENVVWETAPAASNAPASRREKGPAPRDSLPNPTTPIPHLTSPIMVPPDQTQAREATPDPGPAKTPRLLTGLLVREIEVDGPAYPIRLKSPEGRLIAFVDLSGIYLPDLDPYLDQKVYLRGQIHPLPDTPGQLVMHAETLRLAN